MTVRTLEVPQPELQRIASANRNLVEIAESLNGLATDVQAKDPDLAKRLRAQVFKLLDNTDAISSSVSTSVHVISR
jgi:hypothetical protein